jgi:flagellar basal body rod protein FlgG
LLTRAGNFTVDKEGYLVTASGNRVLGMSSAYSISSSQVPVKIPQVLTMTTQGNTDEVEFLTSPLAELNNIEVKKSTDPTAVDYIVQVVHDGGQVIDVPINISGPTPMQQ